jgi:hypothetical protein
MAHHRPRFDGRRIASGKRSSRQRPHDAGIRAELQASKESRRALAARYGLNAKTVRKWRQRTSTDDRPMGPNAPKSTVLTPAEEAIVAKIRLIAGPGDDRAPVAVATWIASGVAWGWSPASIRGGA